MKRGFDLILAALISLISLPFAVIIAIMILFTMGYPVIYCPERPGLKGRPFKMYKFRTMTNKTDANGNPLPDIERLTKLGKFLRLVSLDELPEMINVLKGDMSLVGPRPLAMEYLERYNPEQAKRHDVLPGITGWAQVNGRNLISWEDRFKMDVWYVENHNFLLDLKILLLTVKKVVIREGVVPEGDSVMEDFMGSDDKKSMMNNEKISG